MRWFAAALLAIMALPVQAATVNLTDIGFNTLPGGQMEIRMEFDGTPPEPKAYTIESPARISLDLMGVSSQLDAKKHTVDMGNTRSVVVLESGGRTRVVVNMVELTNYTADVEGNALSVVVGNDGVQDFLTEPKETFGGSLAISETAGYGEERVTIADIDFQRGDQGEGQLIVDLSDPKVDIDVKKEGDEIKVVFLDTKIPENLQRRYDVVDFATPVKMVDAAMVDGRATLSITPSTLEYDYLAYQADNTYVVSLKPLTPEEAEAKKAEFDYVGEKISLNFQDIAVRDVLQIIADFTNMNLVASDTVGGSITLRLEDVPWDQALELILKTKGLDKRQVGNVLMVAPAAEIAERERQEIETQKQLQELAPLQTEYIRIKYAQASEIFNLFKGKGGKGDKAGSTQSILSARASVIVDPRTNALLVTETAEKLENLRRLINLIDVPLRQVMIEARIVVANSDFLEDIGIRWGGLVFNDGSDSSTVFTGRSSQNLEALIGLNNAEEIEVIEPDTYMVDLGANQEQASRFSVGYLSPDYLITAELSALESQGRGEIVSQPKVITGDKQPAVIKSGQEVPYLESSSSGRTTVSFKEAVLMLDVTPNITPDGRVLLSLEIAQDSVGDTIAGEFSSEVPLIDTNSVQTQVLVDNGQTVVLGGVYRTTELENIVKTPFLGDIPYFGRLFRKTFKDFRKQELLIFITPRILTESLVD